jgi:hypothetical protein
MFYRDCEEIVDHIVLFVWTVWTTGVNNEFVNKKLFL